jgi:Uma2 family endonuclease
MARPAPQTHDEDVVTVPATVRFPVELVPPEGFDPGRLETWPRIAGRLEWVAGRLLYMPPCGYVQQVTVVDLVAVLAAWVRVHREFVAGTNEAGMRFGDDMRAADGAIWRRADLGPRPSGLLRVPPVLAAEVAGRDERRPALLEKTRWYLTAGVPIVWLVFPEEREVVVVTRTGEVTYRADERLAAESLLPDLVPAVDEFFVQLNAG